MSLDSKVAVVRGEKRLLNETKFFPAGNLQVGFPIYAVEYSAATSTLFVAGGGGPAKTGVRNSIITFKYFAKTHKVKQLYELSCGQEAPMCMTIHPANPEYAACGVNDRCWIIERNEADHLSLAKSMRSDFAPIDSYQKLVRFSPDGHELLTSGNEDKVRIWNFPWITAISEFSVPHNETVPHKENKIEDCDYDKNGQLIAILTPCGIHIRSRKDSSFIACLSPMADFVFRCTRFLKNVKSKEGGGGGYLVTIENSKSKKNPILTLWKTSSWTRYKSVTLSTRLRVTTLAVSENGKLISFGSADGTVGVYDYDLYTLYFKKELHKFVVTSITITDYGKTRLLVTGSGDGTVRIMPIRKSRPWTWIGLFAFIIFILLSVSFILFLSGIIGDDEL